MSHIRYVAALATMAVVGVLGVAEASYASAAASDCPAGSFCVWKDPNFSNTRFGTERANDNWDWPANVAPIRAMNDNDSSALNRWSNYSAAIYVHDQYQGGMVVCIPRGYQIQSYLSVDDQGSSHKSPNLRSTC